MAKVMVKAHVTVYRKTPKSEDWDWHFKHTYERTGIGQNLFNDINADIAATRKANHDCEFKFEVVGTYEDVDEYVFEFMSVKAEKADRTPHHGEI